MFLFAGMILPESPRWLVKNGRNRRALHVLRSLSGENDAATQLQDIQQTIAADEVQRVRFADLLEPKMRKVLLLGVFLAVLQQWSGLNVIFNYAEEVYRAAGYGLNDILFNIVITGTICLVVNGVAIGTVDRFGLRIPDADRLCRHRAMSRFPGSFLSVGDSGLASSGHNSRGNGLLQHVTGADRVGADLRDLSESNSWRSRLRRRVIPVAGLFCPDLYVPSFEGIPGHVGNVLAIWSHLFSWGSLSSTGTSRKPRARRWNRLNVSWWTNHELPIVKTRCVSSIPSGFITRFESTRLT